MATTKIGFKYPAQTEGELVPETDFETTPMYPGDVLEIHYEYSSVLPYGLTRALYEIQKVKEDYPNAVIHYVEGGDGHVIVQISAASPGGHLSWILVIQILIVISALLAAFFLSLRALRGYLWRPPPPVGDAVITAKDMKTLKGIPNVRITVDGEYVGRTGTGGSKKITDLLVGPHTFAGEQLTGYWNPDTVKRDIAEGQIIDVTIAYHPDDEPEPIIGWLQVDTTPVKGRVFVQGTDYGLGPINIELDRGDYEVSFGPVEGYFTPNPQTVTVQAGMTTSIIGYYKSPEEGIDWEKYIKYALIGGGVILGAAVLLPVITDIVRGRR